MNRTSNLSRSSPAVKFPRVWGYTFGVLLILAGIVLAVVLVLRGIQDFADDVRSLERVSNLDGLDLSLEEGTYFVFDEGSGDVGPFEVKVFRTSDQREIATTAIRNGLTYDIDSFRGRARIAFDVPVLDTYRVEVNASIGSATRFAVGGDLGNGQTPRIVKGLVLGALFGVLGGVVIVGTAFLHARWRIGNQLAQQASRSREIIKTMSPAERAADALGSDDLAGSRSRIREDVHAIRDSVITQSENISDALRQSRRVEQANRALDSIEKRLGDVELVGTVAGVEAKLADRIDEALGQNEDRSKLETRLGSWIQGERTDIAGNSIRTEAEEASFDKSIAAGPSPFEPPPLREPFGESVEQVTTDFGPSQSEINSIRVDLGDTVREETQEVRGEAATRAVSTPRNTVTSATNLLGESTNGSPVSSLAAPTREYEVSEVQAGGPTVLNPEVGVQLHREQKSVGEVVGPSFVAVPLMGVEPCQYEFKCWSESKITGGSEGVDLETSRLVLPIYHPPLAQLATHSSSSVPPSEAVDLTKGLHSIQEHGSDRRDIHRSISPISLTGIAVAPAPPFELFVHPAMEERS